MSQNIANKESIKIEDSSGSILNPSTSDNQTDGSQKTVIQTLEEDVGVQNPFQTDGDSVYCKDIDTDNSDIGDFSGEVCDLFNSLKTVINNTTSDNPKIIKIVFHRTVYAHEIGIGCDSLLSSYGTDITLKLLGSGDVVRFEQNFTGLDGNSDLLKFSPKAFNGVVLEFNTEDSICLSNITIRKALETTATLQGIDANGVIKNVSVTEDGYLTISDSSSGLSIAEGNITGKEFIHKFGYAPDFDTADGVITVWDGANDGGINEMRYNYSITDAIDTISSNNALDTQEIQLQGLDADYNLVTQVATLSGQNKVTLTTPLIRVFRLKNNAVTDLNGYVYVYEDTTISGGIPVDTTKVRAIIENGFNQTLMAVYTIPSGKTGYMRDWYASTAGSSKTSSYIIELRAREYNETLESHKAWQLKHITSIADGGTTYIQHKYEEPEKFKEKTDIEMRMRMTATGASGAAVSAGFDIVLVDN